MNETLSGKHVLIVEDNPLLAGDLDDLMCDHGASVVGPAHTLDTAMTLAQDERIDLAFLDINLGDDLVWPLARLLREQGVPYLFISAKTRDSFPQDLLDAPHLEKPACTTQITNQAATLLAA